MSSHHGPGYPTFNSKLIRLLFEGGEENIRHHSFNTYPSRREAGSVAALSSPSRWHKSGDPRWRLATTAAFVNGHGQ
ncbi:hypothetical protein NL676_002933 [Syzygium grande]|nr:hypothetical protein NL676_002933 [Syzygium grande]